MLPPGLEFFETEGRRIFSAPGPDGSPGNILSAVIMQKRPSPGCYSFGRAGLHEDHDGRWYVIEWSGSDPKNVFYDKVNDAIKALTA